MERLYPRCQSHPSTLVLALTKAGGLGATCSYRLPTGDSRRCRMLTDLRCRMTRPIPIPKHNRQCDVRKISSTSSAKYAQRDASDALELDALEIAADFPLSAPGQPAPGPHGAVGA